MMEKAVEESLISKMRSVNSLLQEVNDTLGPEVTEFEKISDMRLRFPRGYIRTADDFRKRLNLKSASLNDSQKQIQLSINKSVNNSDFNSKIFFLKNDDKFRNLQRKVLPYGPASYTMRLGNCGEFLTASKEFELGQKKKGIRVPPGHSVALIAFETIDFRREQVNKIFPDCDLMGLITPTTDMSREGIVAPTTLVDPGYYGTLNWTITNTSTEERRFLFKEKIFRLIIYKLEKGERPENVYDGDYQNKIGYVRSLRKGPPVGMKETEWEDAVIEGGPEALLDNLMKSGYPWHVLGSRLKMIDQQFKTISEEYGEIYASIEALQKQVGSLVKDSSSISEHIRTVLRDEAGSLQSRWALITLTILGSLIGLALTISGSNIATQFFKKNASLVGLAFILISGCLVFFLFRKKRH
jgi:hypothetical protein